MINKTSILLIEDDIKALSELTEKCLEAGISEKNIFSVGEIESAERYLEIAGISYVIIDADLYNFVIASTIEKFSEYFPIHVIITNAKPEQKTLRMMNDKSLTFINSLDELPEILHGRTPKTISYPYATTNLQNI
ncbi:MAG: hypothetical protein KHX03_03080 [Clostridium sp.]|nr:hypothetical protein [Clostridium sp.]